MNVAFLQRSLGVASQYELQRNESARLLNALQPANVYLRGRGTQGLKSGLKKIRTPSEDEHIPAHGAGVNSISIDPFEGRYLLSGGADSSIAIWDLDAARTQDDGKGLLHKPLGYVIRTTNSHSFGITHVSFYAFDSGAFLGSSYDHTLKLYDAESLQSSASFDLESVVYSHAMSSIAQHVTVACATQHPAVRLVDLRSGAATHQLSGHLSAVLSVAWSPVDEFVLASGSVDGTVRFWDIRRSAGNIGVLDMEDSMGINRQSGQMQRSRMQGRAHAEAVNGLVWTEDGRNLISVGHDERIRVWDTVTGANTLVNFGPLIKNEHLSTLLPVISPAQLTSSGKELLFFPNPTEILAYELFEGALVKRLKVPGPPIKREEAVKKRITALAWRHHDIEMYSAHGDGTIRAWRPHTTEDADADREEEEDLDVAVDEGAGGTKRKADVLGDIYEQLTKRPITFG